MSKSYSAPKRTSIADRIAALQNVGNDTPPPLTSSKTNKSNVLAGRIAALQKNVESVNNTSEGISKTEKPKVGKLRIPTGAVPLTPFGAGPPPSLLKKQKERSERMEKLQQEAANSTRNVPEGEKPKVGKLKPPVGAVPIMAFGAGPPSTLMKKQKQRKEQLEKLSLEAKSTDAESGVIQSADVDADDVLLTRPTIKGKRRPRTRGIPS